MDKENTALIIVDVQNDFLPGGSLAIENGYDVIQPLLEVAENVELVVASRDWHPTNHDSFAEQGGIWPKHCVADSHGAALHHDVFDVAEIIINKGTSKTRDAYSAFDGTDLDDQLKAAGITTVYVGGLATDYCVKATALDAISNGYEVILVDSGHRGVDEDNNGCVETLYTLEAAGVIISAIAE